jgi:hypothetical protein
MHGPRLTPREVSAVLGMAVERLEHLGVPRSYAIEAVARDNKIATTTLKELLTKSGAREGQVV